MIRGDVLDPGLQRERTAMAWSRTALGLVGNGLLVVARHDRSFPRPVAAGLVLLSVLVGVVALVAAARRSRIQHQPDDHITAGLGYAAPLGLLLTVLCGSTLVAIVAHAWAG